MKIATIYKTEIETAPYKVVYEDGSHTIAFYNSLENAYRDIQVNGYVAKQDF